VSSLRSDAGALQNWQQHAEAFRKLIHILRMEHNHIQTGLSPVMSSAIVTYAWVVRTLGMPLELHLEKLRGEQGCSAQRQAGMTIVTVICLYGSENISGIIASRTAACDSISGPVCYSYMINLSSCWGLETARTDVHNS